jgi:hypothetical protein
VSSVAGADRKSHCYKRKRPLSISQDSHWLHAGVGPALQAARFPLVCSLFFVGPTSVNIREAGIVPGRCRAPCLPASTRPRLPSSSTPPGPSYSIAVAACCIATAPSRLLQSRSTSFLTLPLSRRLLSRPAVLLSAAVAPASTAASPLALRCRARSLSLAAPCLPFLRCAPLPIYLYAGAPGLSHPRSLHLSLISPCPTIEAC